MLVLSVASELFPLVKTGGLADVAGALPGALAREGVAVRSLVPGYPAVLRAADGFDAVHQWGDLFGGSATLLAGTAAGLDLFILDAPHLFARAGGPYADAGGRDWPDNPRRFAALAWAAAEIGRGLVPAFAPDVVHAHDWQAGLTPAYLQFAGGRRPGAVVTIHNLAHQGAYPADLIGALRLPPSAFSVEGVEYYGGIGFLKAGLYYADRITTVSPTYAAEIQTPEGGMGLDGLLRARAPVLSGILNGIDETVWDPAADPFLPSPFSKKHPRRRRHNKAALQDRFGLARDPEALLFGVVSRLSWQKGLDLLLDALAVLLEGGAQLALLGSGEPALERGFTAAAAAHPGRLGVAFGYDEALAHLIQAGSDALLVPSRFEPCGLTQLCALRYGSVPVVARVGGLSDTIVDANEAAAAAGVATGIQFSPVNRMMLESAIRRAQSLWRSPKDWSRMQANGMGAEVGWARPARRYAEIYRGLARRAGG
jgi:starch synthase